MDRRQYEGMSDKSIDMCLMMKNRKKKKKKKKKAGDGKSENL